MSVILDPPLPENGFFDRCQSRVERLAIKQPILAIITGVALIALGLTITVMTSSSSWTWPVVGLWMGAALISGFGDSILKTTVQECSHKIYDVVFLWLFPHHAENSCNSYSFTERKVIDEETEEVLGSISYQPGADATQQPVLELNTCNPEKMGYVQGLLLAPEIDTIFRRVINPMIAEAARAAGDTKQKQLRERINQLRIPKVSRQELSGIARGIQDYAAVTGALPSKIDVTALLIAQQFQDIYPGDSNTPDVKATTDGSNTQYHLQWPSRGLLGKFTLIRRHSVETPEGSLRTIESLSLPGFTGVLAGNNSDGLRIGVGRAERAAYKEGVSQSMLAREILEKCSSTAIAEAFLADGKNLSIVAASEHEIVLADNEKSIAARFWKDKDQRITISPAPTTKISNTRNTIARIDYTQKASPRYEWDNYFAAKSLNSQSE